jgi:cytoskeletal protein CcmA (bactofilin family)
LFKVDKSAIAKANKKPVTGRDTGAVTILTSGCHFSGKLYCRGASRVGGRIEGQVVSEGLLIIEEEAIITAEIKAEEVIIQGRVEGKLQATGRVELASTSFFTGDISTPVLVVREGAQFNGHSAMIKREANAPGNGKQLRPLASNGGKGNSKKPDGINPDVNGDSRLEVPVHSAPEVNVRAL